MKNEHGLTPGRERFAQLVASASVTQVEAYRLAFPRSRAWTASTLATEAKKLAAVPVVRARIEALQNEAAEGAILQLRDVFEETRRIMLSTPTGIFKTNGQVRLPHELDAATAAAVASVEVAGTGRARTVKYRFWDKNSALDRAAKILGAFKIDNAQQAAAQQAAAQAAAQAASAVRRIELVALLPVQEVLPDGTDKPAEQQAAIAAPEPEPIEDAVILAPPAPPPPELVARPPPPAAMTVQLVAAQSDDGEEPPSARWGARRGRRHQAA